MEDNIKLKEDKDIGKPTWIIHGVINDDDENEDNIKYHTHGLIKYGSLELELNLPLNKKKAAKIINLIAYEIINGREFKDGDFDESLFNYKISFKEIIGIYEEKDLVLRIIFPDENLKFPWDDGCKEPYKSQI